MPGASSIEWTEATWNPLRGCSRVSKGCQRCYAEGQAMRFSGPGQPYEGLVHMVNGHPTWTGKVTMHEELLLAPIRWQKPHRIFVNSMSDLFHESVPFEFVAKVFAVMACTERHTYQVLTKRPQRMLDFFKWLDTYNTERDLNPPSWQNDYYRNWTGAVVPSLPRAFTSFPEAIDPSAVYPDWKPWREGGRGGGYDCCGPSWPLDNVWLGVSVEDQATANERIPLLLKVPAVVRWISAEPLLGEVNLEAAFARYDTNGEPSDPRVDHDGTLAIKWVVAGGESGPRARPMHPDWARKLRDQCVEAGCAFFFKQWGAYAPFDFDKPQKQYFDLFVYPDGQIDIPDHRVTLEERGEIAIAHLGKTRAGRVLDGRTWDEYPDA